MSSRPWSVLIVYSSFCQSITVFSFQFSVFSSLLPRPRLHECSESRRRQKLKTENRKLKTTLLSTACPSGAGRRTGRARGRRGGQPVAQSSAVGGRSPDSRA